ncbi:hypothetical protein [Enterobacter kobei]|uniref:hypothetical protein n=1 Tax=Enterobacter kobei TaxID=208224 RepID=UPI00079657D1|nr:hypothetical protein [Enterobacter kobei]CZW55044.1 Uncharacterised protein [Enterobacter kobei]
MSTITRDQLRERAREKVKSLEFAVTQTAFADSRAELEEELELARIALASLEAEPAIHRWRRVTSEPYGPYHWHYGDFIGFSKPVDGIEDEYFYSAPPAPANAEPAAWLWSHRKHPSEVSLVRPEDDERAEGAHWSGWSCQALYAAPPAPVSVPDEVCWEDVPEEITEDDMALASAWAHGFNQCRAAMLKHSEPFIVTSDHRMMEMPQVEAINAVTAMLQGVENAETPTTMQTAPALDSSPKIAELPSGNSPVIPDGWVLVPEEPTHEMLEAGDEQFGTYDVYRRMIAASPQQEVKS